jgi:hypothetical protein
MDLGTMYNLPPPLRCLGLGGLVSKSPLYSLFPRSVHIAMGKDDEISFSFIVSLVGVSNGNTFFGLEKKTAHAQTAKISALPLLSSTIYSTCVGAIRHAGWRIFADRHGIIIKTGHMVRFTSGNQAVSHQEKTWQIVSSSLQLILSYSISQEDDRSRIGSLREKALSMKQKITVVCRNNESVAFGFFSSFIPYFRLATLQDKRLSFDSNIR